MKKNLSSLTVGVDFGTDSARAAIVDAADGRVLATGVAAYPRWAGGLYQHPERAVFRQHPADYLEALEACVRQAVESLGPENAARVAGIGVDATGSTPAPVDENGTPLALLPEFAENENAMFHLWKDHSAAGVAEEVNRLLREGGNTDYTLHMGKYSPEWFWCKILHTVREDEAIRRGAYTWVEHCDWITGVLCGNTAPETMYHSACAAGHKALWHSDWNGLPGAEALSRADPYLCLVRERFGKAPRHAGTRAGSLTPEWAEKLGLPADIAVSGTSCDAHAGAVGAGIRRNTAVCTLGTSSVTMLVEKRENLRGREREVSVYSGAAEHSILPGYVGIESGQAAFGDVFAWCKRFLLWPVSDREGLRQELDNILFARLEAEAAALPDVDFPVALDWFNGRRYPDTDSTQTSLVDGLSLGTTPPELYRGLAFGAVSGLKRNLEGMEQAGLTVNEVVAVGGVAEKSPYLVQMMADALERPVFTLDGQETCAIGAAIYAATAAGVFPDMEAACGVMSAKRKRTFSPDTGKRELYRRQYARYLELAGFKEKKA